MHCFPPCDAPLSLLEVIEETLVVVIGRRQLGDTITSEQAPPPAADRLDNVRRYDGIVWVRRGVSFKAHQELAYALLHPTGSVLAFSGFLWIQEVC
jgi:hypothetical protein